MTHTIEDIRKELMDFKELDRLIHEFKDRIPTLDEVMVLLKNTRAQLEVARGKLEDIANFTNRGTPQNDARRALAKMKEMEG